MQFILGLIGTGIGVYFVLRTENVYRFVGQNAWAEDKFGPGGTRLLIKIIGVLVIFFAFLAITGLFNDFLGFAVSPLVSQR